MLKCQIKCINYLLIIIFIIIMSIDHEKIQLGWFDVSTHICMWHKTEQIDPSMSFQKYNQIVLHLFLHLINIMHQSITEIWKRSMLVFTVSTQIIPVNVVYLDIN